MVTIQELFDLEHTAAKAYLEQFTHPWEALAGISDLILELGAKLGDDYKEIAPQVWVHNTAKIAPTAYIVWQNIVNSYQIYRMEFAKKRRS